MLQQITLNNFRSIENESLDLGKITVLTGANNSGKSSFLYALMVLKNLMQNANRQLDEVLTPFYINLGGFDEMIFRRETQRMMKIGVKIDADTTYPPNGFKAKTNVAFDLECNRTKALTRIAANPSYGLETNINFPVNVSNFTAIPNPDNQRKMFVWNGLFAHAIDSALKVDKEIRLFLEFMTPYSFFQTSVDFVPIQRGFSQFVYSDIPINENIYTEKELAVLLARDRKLEAKVSYYLGKIVNKSFSVLPLVPSYGSFRLQVCDLETGFVNDLVNEGYGIGQLVVILTKALRPDIRLVCIDEPEIHLHPSMIDKLVTVMIEICEKERKQFLLSTHSENLVTALMTNVEEKNIAADDVKVYFLKKEKDTTKLEYQPINEHGQIKGGLKNFYESELNNLKKLFNITE